MSHQRSSYGHCSSIGPVELLKGDYTKMMVVPSGSTFLDPIDIVSHIELWRSIKKPHLAHCPIPHLTSEGHGITVGEITFDWPWLSSGTKGLRVRSFQHSQVTSLIEFCRYGVSWHWWWCQGHGDLICTNLSNAEWVNAAGGTDDSSHTRSVLGSLPWCLCTTESVPKPKGSASLSTVLDTNCAMRRGCRMILVPVVLRIPTK